MSQPFRLDGRAALVTGDASGIGEATCRAFAAAGASVYIVDMDAGRAAALAAALPGSKALVCDIADKAALNALFAGAVPRLDVLVNNAGIGLVGGVLETASEDPSQRRDLNRRESPNALTLNNALRVARREASVIRTTY